MLNQAAARIGRIALHLGNWAQPQKRDASFLASRSTILVPQAEQVGRQY